MTKTVDGLPPADRSSAFANAPMGVALTTPQGVLVDANPALCRMLGETEEELLGAVGRALRRDAKSRRLRAEIEEANERFVLLTPREREVFALVVKGYLNKQIAGRLGTTEQTIKVHRGRVMQKMGAPSLAQLVLMAERLRPPAAESADSLAPPTGDD